MVVNDPIADMLTRIRNAQVAKHDSVTLPSSNTKKSIAKILLNEGYIKSVDYVEDGHQGSMKITLKYVEGKQPVIAGLSASASLACACTPAAKSCPGCWAVWVSPSSAPARA